MLSHVVMVGVCTSRTIGYIDLSKRRVSAEDMVSAEERFHKSKAVHSILRHVADTCSISQQQLYQQFGWHLYTRFGHAYDAFKLAITSVQRATSLLVLNRCRVACKHLLRSDEPQQSGTCR